MSTFSTRIHTLTIKIVWQFNKNHDNGSKNTQRLWQSMALTILFYEELFLQLIKFFHQSPYLNFLTSRGSLSFSLSTMPTTMSMLWGKGRQRGEEDINYPRCLPNIGNANPKPTTTTLSHTTWHKDTPPPGANHIVCPINISTLPPPINAQKEVPLIKSMKLLSCKALIMDVDRKKENL